MSLGEEVEKTLGLAEHFFLVSGRGCPVEGFEKKLQEGGDFRS